jgi:hypothetical protein
VAATALVGAGAGVWAGTRSGGTARPSPQPGSGQLLVPVDFAVVSPSPGEVKVIPAGPPPGGAAHYYVDTGSGAGWSPAGTRLDYTFNVPANHRTCVSAAALVPATSVSSPAPRSSPHRKCIVADGAGATRS